MILILLVLCMPEVYQRSYMAVFEKGTCANATSVQSQNCIHHTILHMHVHVSVELSGNYLTHYDKAGIANYALA